MKKQTVRSALGVLFVGASVIQGANRKLFSGLAPTGSDENAEKIQGVMMGALAGIGVSFLIPKARLLARWSSAALLAASLPPAFGQVKNPPKELTERGFPKAAIIARIPIQVGVLAAAWFSTRKAKTSDADAA